MSLTGAYDDQNILAKIMRGEIPSAKVFEDDEVLAIMDAFPQAEGHVLVIPKARARNFLEMEPDAAARAVTRIQKIARAVAAALKPDGVIVTQFNGSAAGQTIFHVHFHIIPRWDSRPMGRHSSGEMADMDALTALAEKIAAEI
jgi:histidine triad (HIT) family protein